MNRAVKFLVTELNHYIQLKTGEKDIVIATKLMNSGGEVAFMGKKIGCVLVNVEEERIMKAQSAIPTPMAGSSGRLNPEIKLNLYLLFAVNPEDDDQDKYYDSLENLTHVVKFFQSKNQFNLENSPTLDPELQYLRLELYSLPIEQQNYLWGSLGTHYLPSVLFRVRLLRIQEEVWEGTDRLIEEVSTQFTNHSS